MIRTRHIALPVAAASLSVLATCAPAQSQSPSRPDAGAAAKGAVVYVRYCVACHGVGAKGDGPLAADLRVPVPDMTTLSARSGGRFPEERVRRIIQSGELLRGHGTADMPAWGDAFKRTGGIEASTPAEAIHNLTQYLWSLQQPVK